VTVIVQPEAEADLGDAFRWYENKRSGLGHEMIDEAALAFSRIAENPLRPRALHRGTRRVRLRRFPYEVLYIARGDRVFVLAVLHERRNPKWSGHGRKTISPRTNDGSTACSLPPRATLSID
jgi:plasmid stabilization system protein ParE